MAAERGAHLTSTVTTGEDGQTGPSIFEVLAQENLMTSLRPAIKHVARVCGVTMATINVLTIKRMAPNPIADFPGDKIGLKTNNAISDRKNQFDRRKRQSTNENSNVITKFPKNN